MSLGTARRSFFNDADSLVTTKYVNGSFTLTNNLTSDQWLFIVFSSSGYKLEGLFDDENNITIAMEVDGYTLMLKGYLQRLAQDRVMVRIPLNSTLVNKTLVRIYCLNLVDDTSLSYVQYFLGVPGDNGTIYASQQTQEFIFTRDYVS
jgi:hypothetical protein